MKVFLIPFPSSPFWLNFLGAATQNSPQVSQSCMDLLIDGWAPVFNYDLRELRDMV